MEYHVIYTLIYMKDFLAAREWSYKVVSHFEWLLYYGMDKVVFTGTEEECNDFLTNI